MLRRGSFAALLLALALGAASCDNAVCVFGPDGCSNPGGTPGGLGTEAATLPGGGEVVRQGRPTIERILPAESGFAHSRAPVVLEFSESMAPSTVLTAFGVQLLDIGGFPGPFLPLTASLAAEGRVLILLAPQSPAPGLTPGDYQIVLRDTATPADLTGQLLQEDPGALGFFSVDVTDDATPVLLASFPEAGATNASAVGELVLVFDRPMQEAGFLTGGFGVLIDDATPAFPSPPAPLLVQAGTPPIVISIPDRRVWLWRPLDAAVSRVPLPANALVEVTLSPTSPSAPLLGVDGGTLELTEFDFRVAPFSAPSGIEIASEPPDAIGIENLSASGASPLAIGVEVADAEPGDTVNAYLFGNGLTDAGVLVAVLRSKQVPAPAPPPAALPDVQGATPPMVTFTLEDLDLVLSPSPLEAIFSDGPLAVAINVQRGSAVSPLAVLDVSDDAGLQDAVLDTVRPELVSLFGADAGSNDFSSWQRGLALAGRASERLSRVEVRVPSLTLDNGTGLVIGASEVGAAAGMGSVFLARPVSVPRLGGVDGLGSIPPVVDYEATLVDRAGNEGLALVTGAFTQLGNVGPDPLGPDSEVQVRVFDAVTKLPISGARVVSFADAGNGTDYPELEGGDSDGFGEATVDGHASGQAGTIVVVSHPAYDVFSFHGVPSNRLDVPLYPFPGAFAAVGGTVTTTTLGGQTGLGGLGKRVSDSRRVFGVSPRSTPCFGFPFVPTCDFAGFPIHAGEPGAVGFVGGTLSVTMPSQASGAALVRAFGLALPAPPAAGGATQDQDLALGAFLTEDVPAEELPIQLPNVLLDASLSGLVLTDLVDDPTYTGAPAITVEANVPGLSGVVLVGVGLGFATAAMGEFDVRSAFPGAVDDAGSLAGSLDSDLLLRLELADGDGRIAGARPRESALAGLPEPVTVTTAEVPEVLAPPSMGVTGSAAFEVDFANGLASAIGAPGSDVGGLFRVTLVDSSGRAWSAWRLADSQATLEVRFPDLAASLGDPLAPGPTVAVVAGFGWSGFDPLDFTWTDVDREYDLFAQSPPHPFAVAAP